MALGKLIKELAPAFKKNVKTLQNTPGAKAVTKAAEAKGMDKVAKTGLAAKLAGQAVSKNNKSGALGLLRRKFKFKEGGMADKEGRAMKRKTADTKGRAMKKGK